MPYKDPQKAKEAKARWYLAKDRKRKLVDKNRRERASRKQIVDEYKVLHGCARCGYKDYAIAIDAHHTGEKNFCISDGVKGCKAIEAILVELEKCELVCANCHRIEHHT